ncbi:MAG: M23 family metallopeptidase [Oscillospiraceae bacterium]|nr:M23 family metallopeptidase [Oscillospiraceae bacterium]
MKTYEEMARDVLKRRDEELLKTQQTSQLNAPPEVVYPGEMKKRSWLPRIAIPCAAAVLVGVVGLNVWKNIRSNQNPNQTPGIAAADEDGEYTFQNFVREEPESIYKGGECYFSINLAKRWNVYSQPALLEEDFRPIDDDKINNYYGMEFDRLSTLFPEWESTHEPFGTYEHDEDDGFVASHAVISSTNSITYKPDAGSTVIVSARYQSYCSASVDDAQPSIVNGFDAMIYHIPINEAYAADITMGNVTVTIRSSFLDEYEFCNILNIYTAPPESLDIDNYDNQNQTMENKIVLLDNRPDFILRDIHYEPDYTDYSTNPDVIWRRYSAEELNAVYGLDFLCFDKLHPDWTKFYNELEFGVYYKTDNHAIGGDIPQNCEILEARNEVKYRISEDYSITIITRLGEIPDGDVEHSVINGYDAVIFRESPRHNIFGAIIDMDGTLICATMEMTTSKTESGEEFVDLLREYTSEAAKYVKPESITPSEFTVFNAVDPFDDYITYEVSWDVEACWWKNTSAGIRWDISKEVVEADTCLGYLKDFFGTDKLPVDEQYKGNFMRRKDDGEFYCHFKGSAKAYSPVDGKVVGACYGSYNRGLGNSVAVEFGDGKYFIIGHLDEINVAVGDTVKAGQELGVCGNSGNVYESPAAISLITMQKVD